MTAVYHAQSLASEQDGEPMSKGNRLRRRAAEAELTGACQTE